MGILYLVSTPIGNLEDITLRGLRVLREVSLIAAEDTRHTSRLLKRYDIETPCRSYHEHNKLTRLDDVLTALANGDVALVSDAGTPALSDPGFELVNACIAAGFAVVPIPGPSAPIAALVASGLPTDRFIYVGFLPRRSAERRAFLAELEDGTATIICFETPHRLVAALTDVREALGDRQIVVASELTKLHEKLRRGRVSELLAHFTAQRPRGEFTLVIAGRPANKGTKRRAASAIAAADAETAEEGDADAPDEAQMAERLRELRQQGMGGSAAARTVAKEVGVQKAMVYQLWLQLFGDEA